MPFSPLPSSSQKTSLHRPLRLPLTVLALLMLAYAVNVMDRSVLAVLLESIKHQFHTTDTQQGLLGGLAFALFYATLGVPIAALADRTSRRNVLANAIRAALLVVAGILGGERTIVLDLR